MCAQREKVREGQCIIDPIEIDILLPLWKVVGLYILYHHEGIRVKAEVANYNRMRLAYRGKVEVVPPKKSKESIASSCSSILR